MQCSSPFLLKNEISDRSIGSYLKLVPCGKCLACRKVRGSEWAERIKREFQKIRKGIFLTLTYSDDNLPVVDGKATLDKNEFKNFLRRFKRYFKDRQIKYFACGEFGDLRLRPHYHSILLGVDIHDMDCYYYDGEWRSRLLDNKLWCRGLNSVGLVCAETIYYVTGYILKTGNLKYKDDVFQLQSLGLGGYYIDENIDEMASKIRAHRAGYIDKLESMPRYYAKKIVEKYPDLKGCMYDVGKREAYEKKLILLADKYYPQYMLRDRTQLMESSVTTQMEKDYQIMSERKGRKDV